MKLDTQAPTVEMVHELQLLALEGWRYRSDSDESPRTDDVRAERRYRSLDLGLALRQSAAHADSHLCNVVPYAPVVL